MLTFNNQTLSAAVQALKKIMWGVGNNAFSFIIIFIVIDVMIAELLFYVYVVRLQAQKPEAESLLTSFQVKTYQSVLEEWKKRDGLFQKANTIIYYDPFQ